MNPHSSFDPSQRPHRRYNALSGRGIMDQLVCARGEITVPAIDRLAALMHAAIGGEGGARMTGGGFGGCVVALLPRHRVAGVRRAVEAGYRSPDGESALVFECHVSAAAGPFML